MESRLQDVVYHVDCYYLVRKGSWQTIPVERGMARKEGGVEQVEK